MPKAPMSIDAAHIAVNHMRTLKSAGFETVRHQPGKSSHFQIARILVHSAGFKAAVLLKY